jgi:electron transfer flavoprotein alpha subunit
MKALVFAESRTAAHDLCGGARTLVEEVIYVTFKEPLCGIADKVIALEVPADQAKEAAFETICQIYQNEQPEIVLSEPTCRLKNIVGRLAAHEGASVITDVTAFHEGVTESMYFGGVGVREAKSTSPTAFCTVAPGAFGEVEASGTDVIETYDFIAPSAPLSCLSCEPLPPAEVDLNAADRVVAAGRGFANEELLHLAREFSKNIGGELGCTRPLTESENWFPREAYIGVSGLILTPEIYVGIGVSGQMQHMVGVNRAKLSFAINKDKNAPIFSQVDYGLVGDIESVLPLINAKLAQA